MCHIMDMELDKYLKDNFIFDADFALQIGVTKMTVYRYRTGKAYPWPRHMKRIENVTKGKVTRDDFRRKKDVRKFDLTIGGYLENFKDN